MEQIIIIQGIANMVLIFYIIKLLIYKKWAIKEILNINKLAKDLVEDIDSKYNLLKDIFEEHIKN